MLSQRRVSYVLSSPPCTNGSVARHPQHRTGEDPEALNALLSDSVNDKEKQQICIGNLHILQTLFLFHVAIRNGIHFIVET